VASDKWLRSVATYTVAGCFSATLVGASLGWVGRLLRWPLLLWLIPAMALVLAAREWGWIHFRLPECERQTERFWAREFGFVMASAMWGFHIGLGFATRITYGGFFVLAAMVLAVGDPVYGAIVMLGYWLGRSIPVWLAPALWSAHRPEELVITILDNRSKYRQLVGLGLLWSAAIAGLTAFQTLHLGR
jgi:cytochrome c biogenesis protein CcdA